MTAVYFSVSAEFSSSINRDFWRKAMSSPFPFTSFVAIGGTTRGHFHGVVHLNLPKKAGFRAVRHEVASLLVAKVELLSTVGVTRLLFDEVSIGV